MLIASGSNMFIMFAIPRAKLSTYSSNKFLTSSLLIFSSIAFVKSEAPIYSVIPSIFCICSLNFFFEQYTSKQPLLPQLHSSPFLFITICPNSKPAFRIGFINWPPKKTAPPIPVPIHKNTQSLYSFNEPLYFSANAAHFPSFCKFIFNSLLPNASLNF